MRIDPLLFTVTFVDAMLAMVTDRLVLTCVGC
jgi:hypothetical protein